MYARELFVLLVSVHVLDGCFRVPTCPAFVVAKVICRSMGYTHGSISTSPCGFYGGSDLCAATGSPVVSCEVLRFFIKWPLLLSGHVGLDMRWIRMECGRMLMGNARRRLHGSCFRCCCVLHQIRQSRRARRCGAVDRRRWIAFHRRGGQTGDIA